MYINSLFIPPSLLPSLSQFSLLTCCHRCVGDFHSLSAGWAWPTSAIKLDSGCWTGRLDRVRNYQETLLSKRSSVTFSTIKELNVVSRTVSSSQNAIGRLERELNGGLWVWDLDLPLTLKLFWGVWNWPSWGLEESCAPCQQSATVNPARLSIWGQDIPLPTATLEGAFSVRALMCTVWSTFTALIDICIKQREEGKRESWIIKTLLMCNNYKYMYIV